MIGGMVRMSDVIVTVVLVQEVQLIALVYLEAADVHCRDPVELICGALVVIALLHPGVEVLPVQDDDDRLAHAALNLDF